MTELSVAVTVQSIGDGACTVIRLVGEADTTTQVLGDVLDAEVSKNPKLLLVDMSGLRFIDSSALGMIVRSYRNLSSGGGVLALVSPTPSVLRILRLTEIDQAIQIYESLGEAIG